MDAGGNITVAAVSNDGITRVALAGGTPTPIVTMYNGARFDAPMIYSKPKKDYRGREPSL